MPLYEYQCKQCGHRFEKIQSFSAAPITECPTCGGEVEKLISAPAIQFKGSGWYVSDYGKGGSHKANKADGAKGESSSGGESSGGSESKSAGEAKSSGSSSGSSSEGGAASAAPAASPAAPASKKD